MDLQVHCEEIALKTPLSDVFAAFLSGRNPIFLDSSMPDDRLGRNSYIAADPLLVLSSKNSRVSLQVDGASPLTHWRRSLEDRFVADSSGDAFAVLQRLIREHSSNSNPGLPPFQGGVMGCFGYDLGRHLEALPSRALDDLECPDLYLGLYPWVIAYDHAENRGWLIVSAPEADSGSTRRLMNDVRRRVLSVDSGPRPVSAAPVGFRWSSNFTREQYLAAVGSAKDYIAAGDIYEVCLSQRLMVQIDESPWDVYRRMRKDSPVPYGAYFGLPDAAVVCGSPELFLRLREGRVETRPIKGTRPRGEDPERDAQLVSELRASEKEQAENLMIVDLLRNDLGRVCRTASIEVPDLFRIESYSTVHQMVSTVRGDLRPGVDAVDLLRASFPGGSVTGCPKIRAMQIIDELEPTQRGLYCGSMGCIAFNGSMDTNIVIRTIVVKGGRAYLQVGGAIVADSDPEAEYRETLDKAQAALLALGGARRRPEGK